MSENIAPTPPARFAATRTARLARARLERLIEGQGDDTALWRKVQQGVPEGWATLEDDIECWEDKVKITIRIDTSVARFYRAMGKGYQARMNRILATYAQMKIGEVAPERALERELDAYYQRVDGGQMPFTRGCKVTTEDKLRRCIIMSLISDLRLDIGDCNRQFGIDFTTRFHRELAALDPMARDGLLKIGPEELAVTHRGRPFLRNICMPFDAYLNAHNGDQPPPQFSATI